MVFTSIHLKNPRFIIWTTLLITASTYSLSASRVEGLLEEMPLSYSRNFLNMARKTALFVLNESDDTDAINEINAASKPHITPHTDSSDSLFESKGKATFFNSVFKPVYEMFEDVNWRSVARFILNTEELSNSNQSETRQQEEMNKASKATHTNPSIHETETNEKEIDPIYPTVSVDDELGKISSMYPSLNMGDQESSEDDFLTDDKGDVQDETTHFQPLDHQDAASTPTKDLTKKTPKNTPKKRPAIAMAPKPLNILDLDDEEEDSLSDRDEPAQTLKTTPESYGYKEKTLTPTHGPIYHEMQYTYVNPNGGKVVMSGKRFAYVVGNSPHPNKFKLLEAKSPKKGGRQPLVIRFSAPDEIKDISLESK